MAPSRRAAQTTADTSAFPSWDELVAEAHVDTPPYRLPLPAVKGVDGKVFQETETIEIPVFDGERYLQLMAAQRVGDAQGCMNALFPDREERQKVVNAMRGAPWPIVDVVATKVIRHFYGLDISPKRPDSDAELDEAAEDVGKSDAE